ncbi:acyl-CoA dehydrogenase family protein [Curvivirga aplysinae]|uniref:acyl-CoA dehydrogenase family protein n=1 Tax=Curvivirga aplysinae TaxID=2529852 RepID=UPI002E253BE7|nr:acyl-CoA dehydrogenase [Curvivirga aplysinae]
MDFQLSEEQIAIQDMARSFAENEMMPYVEEWDEKKIFPVDTLRAAADLGLGGIYSDPDYGGSGLGRLDSVVIFEELAAACPSTAAFLSIHNMASWMVSQFASDTLKSKYLPDMLSMNKIASYCLTEPGSGSDAAALRSTAELDGDEYVLNGSKAFISGAGRSDVYVVMVRTGDEGPKGISCVIVENGTEGLSFGAQERKMGWNSQPTAQVQFDNCRIPVSNRVGNEGDGFKIAMAGLDGGRLNIAACSIGAARASITATIQYMNERKQFGKPLAAFQALQFRLADMATELDAARLMLHRGATSLDNKIPEATKHCAMAKRFATDVGFNVVNEALQLHGGYGYLRDFPLERYLRDLRVHQILEGTNEIMRVIIARAMLQE